MKQGIVMGVYGARGYGFAVFNLAYSIKHFTPEIKITLFTEMQTISQIYKEDLTMFDNIIFLRDQDYKTDGMPSVAKLKHYVLKNSPYDETLYLDADTVCISDVRTILKRLHEAQGTFFMCKQGTGGKGQEIHYDAWSKHEYAYPFFSLNDDAVWTTTNSSWIYVKKSDQTTEILKTYEYFLNKRYPLMELKNKWIAGQIPDELLWSGTIANMKIDIGDFKPVYYGNTYDAMIEIEEKYQFISYYGRIASGVNLVKPHVLDYIDRHMKVIYKKNGRNYTYPMQFSFSDKALNSK